MDFFEQLCQEMAKNPHVLTFGDIGVALGRGALVGQQLKIPGGIVLGAVAGLSLEALQRVENITEDLIKEQAKNKPRPTM